MSLEPRPAALMPAQSISTGGSDVFRDAQHQRAEGLLAQFQAGSIKQKKLNRALKKTGVQASYFDHILSQDPAWAAKNPERAQAAIARAQQQMFETDFKGFEDEALGFAMDKDAPENAATKAGADVARSFDDVLAQGQAQRRLARRGIVADADALAQGERGRDLTRAASMVTAQNAARSTTRDQQVATGTDLGNVGQGLAAGAMQNLTSASGLATQRKMSNEASSQAGKMATISTGATGGIAGAMYGAQAGGVSGPWGAAIGAGLGLAVGYAGTRG
jgi:hypothetical protein